MFATVIILVEAFILYKCIQNRKETVKLQKRKKPFQLRVSYRTAERKAVARRPKDKERYALLRFISVCEKMTYKITHTHLYADIP